MQPLRSSCLSSWLQEGCPHVLLTSATLSALKDLQPASRPSVCFKRLVHNQNKNAKVPYLPALLLPAPSAALAVVGRVYEGPLRVGLSDPSLESASSRFLNPVKVSSQICGHP